MTSDLDAIEAAHHECHGICEVTLDPMGQARECDTRPVLERLREVEQERDKADAASDDDAAAIQELGSDLLAARADADRLAEALRGVLARRYERMEWRVAEPTAFDALRAHEAAK
jgi:lambda repressor-like predicted transcriptional regulator